MKSHEASKGIYWLGCADQLARRALPLNFVSAPLTLELALVAVYAVAPWGALPNYMYSGNACCTILLRNFCSQRPHTSHSFSQQTRLIPALCALFRCTPLQSFDFLENISHFYINRPIRHSLTSVFVSCDLIGIWNCCVQSHAHFCHCCSLPLPPFKARVSTCIGCYVYTVDDIIIKHASLLLLL